MADHIDDDLADYPNEGLDKDADYEPDAGWAEGDTADDSPEDNPENVVAMGSAEAPQGPEFSFGNKMVVNGQRTQELIVERMREHEEAITREEIQVFEHIVLGDHQEAAHLEQRIQRSYALLERMAAAFQKMRSTNG